MEDLSELQEKILSSDENAMFVEAAAASGKTRLLTAKIVKEAQANKGQVVAFTFTNAAAEEMSSRLNLEEMDNVFVGTIHSYCFRLLMSCGINNALKYVSENDFDALFDLVKKHPECIKPVYCVLCDETQDCNEAQFEFIFNMMHPQKYFCCYDERQAIYRWRDAHPEYIDDYIEQTHGKVFYLNENYRNAPVILDYAKSIIRLAGVDYLDNSIPMRTEKGRLVTVEYNANAIARTIQKYGNYEDWFVLTRTNAQIEEMMTALQKLLIPCVSFKRSELNNKEVNKVLHSDQVKVLTIHCAKGLEAPNVIVVGAKFYNLEERCISYVAATRARDLLVWTKMPLKSKRGITQWEKY